MHQLPDMLRTMDFYGRLPRGCRWSALVNVLLWALLLSAVATAAIGQELVDTGWAIGKPPTMGPDLPRNETRSRFRLVPLEPGKALSDPNRSLRTPSAGVEWQPHRDSVREGAQHIAHDRDWAASALSDFSLQNGPAGQATSSPGPANDRGIVVEIRPDEEAEDGVAFRPPNRLDPQATKIAVPTDTQQAPIPPDTDPGGSISQEARTAKTGAPESAVVERQLQPKAESNRQLDTGELDRLLKSWDNIARQQTPVREKPSPAVKPNEPRPLTPKSVGAATPIELPEDRIELQPKPAPKPGDRRSPPPAAEPRVDGSSASPSSRRTTDPQISTRTEPRLTPKQEDKPQVVVPVEPLRPLTRNEERLRDKVRNVLKMYYRRPLNSRDHDPWEMMHGMLAFGVHSRVLQNGPTGKPITAVGWLCYNKPCKRKTLLYMTPEGDLRARWGVGVQGHYGQFLAMLAQCRVSRDYPIRVDGKEFTIDDLIEAEKVTCHAGEELTFKLIALMHYCPSDERWVSEQGAEWDIRRLIREELSQPIRGAPCGGTHRLSGLSLAARTRVKRGEPLDGEFKQAEEFYKRYQRYAFQFQNSDGSLSTNWFRGPGSEEDINRRIKTSGHILEWLLYSLEDEELHDRRVFRAVNYIASLMASNYYHDWEIGPLCHATHALVIYDERLFQKYDAHQESEASIAEQHDPGRSASRNSRHRR